VTLYSFFIEVITGTNLTVRPAKIISGHEPSKTNELLQEIGKALDKKVSARYLPMQSSKIMTVLL
jgi:TRAF3-interacting protein 1